MMMASSQRKMSRDGNGEPSSPRRLSPKNRKTATEAHAAARRSIIMLKWL